MGLEVGEPRAGCCALRLSAEGRNIWCFKEMPYGCSLVLEMDKALTHPFHEHEEVTQVSSSLSHHISLPTSLE